MGGSVDPGAHRQEACDLMSDEDLPPGHPVVLIADDEPAIRRLYSQVLSTAGFEVVEAVDGEDALAKLATIGVSLVLLDASMPRLDGLGVIRRLRADPATARLPIILVTGSGEEANRVRDLDLGVGRLPGQTHPDQ